MQLEPNTDIESNEPEGEAPLPEGGAGSNRNFVILIGALIVVFICLAGGLGAGAVWMGQQRHVSETKVAVVNLTNAQVATLNAQPTATPVPPTKALPTATTAPSNTPQPVKTTQAPSTPATATPLLAVTASNTPEVTVAAATNTPAAGAQNTKTSTVAVSPTKTSPTATPGKGTPSATTQPNSLTKTATATQLPGTGGFADEAGVPMLIVLAVGLVGVTFIVRRLRHSLR
jgi:hypothetical protein